LGGKSLAFALQKLCFCKALIFSCLQNTKLSLPYNGKIEQLLLSEWAKKKLDFRKYLNPKYDIKAE